MHRGVKLKDSSPRRCTSPANQPLLSETYKLWPMTAMAVKCTSQQIHDVLQSDCCACLSQAQLWRIGMPRRHSRIALEAHIGAMLHGDCGNLRALSAACVGAARYDAVQVGPATSLLRGCCRPPAVCKQASALPACGLCKSKCACAHAPFAHVPAGGASRRCTWSPRFRARTAETAAALIRLSSVLSFII
eukprot:COSAG02_NODE_625_length_19372_cov_14.475355_15_plen_190_part_00